MTENKEQMCRVMVEALDGYLRENFTDASFNPMEPLMQARKLLEVDSLAKP